MRFDPGLTDVTEADLRHVLDALGMAASDIASAITIRGTPQDLGSPLRIIDGGAIALAAQAAAIASLAHTRTGRQQDIEIDARQIVFALKPFIFTKINGRSETNWAQDVFDASCSGHFTCADGRTVYMANIVPKLSKATLDFLNCSADRVSVAAAIARWNAEDLEQAMTAQGIPIAVMRDSEEWLTTEQGATLRDSPLIDVNRLSETAPIVLEAAERPFEGVKVLDMTHVVAGPMITRGLAEYGANVLHLSSANPDLQDPKAVSDEFRLGKSIATLELTDTKARSRFAELLLEADVFVHSWRPSVFERFGFGAEQIAALKPGIIQISVSCYGPTGPWAARGGFDGLALASTGATALEAHHDKPKLSPPGVLTDALAGFLGTATVASLLQRRAREGGSYRAELSLARIAMWLLDLGLDTVDPARPNLVDTPRMRRLETAQGPVDHVAPAIRFSEMQSLLSRGGRVSEPHWP